MAAPFSAGGVAVSVRVESRGNDLRVLADLRPERAGFHVYSLALPDGGVDGIGIPTRIRAAGALRPTGPATTEARQRVLRPEGLAVRLPVYRDGQVTLELPCDGSRAGTVTGRGCSSPTARAASARGVCCPSATAPSP
ncbi:hypothetical protein H4K36_02810 [Streptomyces sp. DHE7-1]|nr:hypothetical protein [Streptomyces sp. DHE7-1]